MEEIDKGQIQTIYAIGSKLGIVGRGSDHDDELHTLVSALTGKIEVKSLTGGEAAKVITELRRRADGLPHTSMKKPLTASPSGMTPGQQGKVWKLMYELSACDIQPGAAVGERLCGIIRKELALDATPAHPFGWMDCKAGGRLIETIKGYLVSAKRKSKTREESG